MLYLFVYFRVKRLRLDVIFHNIDIRTLYNLQYGFVELKALFNGNIDIDELIFSLDEFVKSLKLVHVFFTEPFPDFCELCSD